MTERKFDKRMKDAVAQYPTPDKRQLETIWQNIEGRLEEPKHVARGVGRSGKRIIAMTAAAAVLVLVCFTSPVQALAAKVYRYFFPDKPGTIISLEGTDEHVDFSGEVIEFPAGSPFADYGVYIDKEIYLVSIDGGTLTARPVDYTEEDMQATPVYMTITQYADTTVENETTRQLERMTNDGALDAKPSESVLLAKYDAAALSGNWFDWETGYRWDGAMEDVYIFSNGNGGVFVVTSHYFAEAVEGHCARMAQMIDTIEVFKLSSEN